MEKTKKKYRVEGKTGDEKLTDLRQEELIRKIAGLSGVQKALLASSSKDFYRVIQPLLNLDRKKEIEDNIKIEEEYIEDTGFSGANLSNTSFSGANFKVGYFEKCELSNADFSNASLDATNFNGVDLSTVFLTYTT